MFTEYFSECIAIDNETSRVELRELTDVMAENLSETATIISLNFVGGTTRVWRDRIERKVAVDWSTLAELKRRAMWRDEHEGWLS